MLVLALLVGVFIFLTYSTENDNRKKEQSNILYPFSGYLAPPGEHYTAKNNPGVGQQPEEGLYLVGMKGGQHNEVPQIKCPEGYKINIVGAFIEVTDPYGECGTTPDPTLSQTCGLATDKSNTAFCSKGDCPGGMECMSGKCVPKTCTSSTQCGGTTKGGVVTVCNPKLGESCKGKPAENGLICINGTFQIDPSAPACVACIDPKLGIPISQSSSSQGTCAAMPLCANVKEGINNVCSPVGLSNDQYKCRPRDASAYLSSYCNGKQECLGNSRDKWLPNVKNNNPFGPLPCQIQASSTSGEYYSLPIINGWGGGTPNNAKNSAPVTYNQGYHVHGIYTCVPDDE